MTAPKLTYATVLAAVPITSTELARRIDMAESIVLKHLRKMEERGVLVSRVEAPLEAVTLVRTVFDVSESYVSNDMLLKRERDRIAALAMLDEIPWLGRGRVENRA